MIIQKKQYKTSALHRLISCCAFCHWDSLTFPPLGYCLPSKAWFPYSPVDAATKDGLCCADMETERLQAPQVMQACCHGLWQVDFMSNLRSCRWWFVSLHSASGYMEIRLKCSCIHFFPCPQPSSSIISHSNLYFSQVISKNVSNINFWGWWTPSFPHARWQFVP